MYEKSDSFNQVLTAYAQGAYQNPSEELDLTALFFPALKVGSNVGEFDKYAWSPALTAVDTLLARDGTARRIQMDKTPDYWNCKPHALEIATFRPDVMQDDAAMLREDKLRTLMSAQFVSRNVEAVQKVKAAVTAQTGKGVWSNTGTDIITELDGLLRSVVAGTGRKANKLVMGRQAWATLRNHESIKDRAHGLAYGITPEALKEMLSYGGLEVVIADTSALVNNAMTELLATDVIALYNEATPSRTDLSFGKEFTLMPNGPEVLSYEEHAVTIADVLLWSSDCKVTNANAAARLVVS